MAIKMAMLVALSRSLNRSSMLPPTTPSGAEAAHPAGISVNRGTVHQPGKWLPIKRNAIKDPAVGENAQHRLSAR
jgi:hypothetical protein